MTREVAAGIDLTRQVPDRDGVAWLQAGDGLVGLGSAVRIDAGQGPQRFAVASDRWAALVDAADVDDPVGVAGTGPVALGSFTFTDDAAGSSMVVPTTIIGQRHGRAWVTTVTSDGSAPPTPRLPTARDLPPPQADRPRYAGASVPDLLWLEAVAEAVKRLTRGDLDKVVLARDHALWAKAPFAVAGVAARLAARFPDCFTFIDRGLVGATPELLVRRLATDVTSIVLAGSTARSADPARDAELAQALLASAKDVFEHRLAADSVEAVLGPLAPDLTRTGPTLLQLDNVTHLQTRLHGRLFGGSRRLTALDLAGGLHPTAAVGGTPTAAALGVIRELEGLDRGRYAAPIGWVDGRGDGEFGIALRCAELSGARARLFAGAGIVAASLPEAELEETRVKLLAMQSVLGDV